MTEKVAIALKLETARAFMNEYPNVGLPLDAVAAAIKAALPPEYPEGTFAKLHYTNDNGECVAFAQWRNGEWQYANGIGSYEFRNLVTKVEPLRVLADDEIAVKRPLNTAGLRTAIGHLEQSGFAWIPGWIEDIADALDAEARP